MGFIMSLKPLALIFFLLMVALSPGVLVDAFAAPPKAGMAKKTARIEAVPARNEIELTHQLNTRDAERLAALVERFNRQQADGEPRIHLARAEAQSKKVAPLNLVTPGTMANFLVKKSAFKPVYQVMKENGVALPMGDFSADLLAGERRNKPNALPVAFSTPVLFYNKRLFRLAGLDPDAPPKTWQEMQAIAGALMDRGVACPYTSSWPVWVHIDNMSAVSGTAIADRRGKLVFNNLPQVKHIAMLASWHKARYFQTFGRGNEADAHFYNNECAMLTSDAWAHNTLREAPGLELGVAPLPYHDDLYGSGSGSGHTLAAGAALWVGAGYKAKDYKVVARFIRFLLTQDTQIALARAGGFLPLTETARVAMRGTLLQDEERALDVAYASMKGLGAEQALRVSTLDPVRIIVDEELEQVWANRKSAKAALDTAVSRGNAVLSAKPALKKVLAF
jgi:sn-glycerol 3-phosphate transport system substrate-binding protein